MNYRSYAEATIALRQALKECLEQAEEFADDITDSDPELQEWWEDRKKSWERVLEDTKL